MGHSEDQVLNAQPHAVNAGRMNSLAIWEKNKRIKDNIYAPALALNFNGAD